MASKYLVVYYSRTGGSERLAKALQKKLGSDIDRIGYAKTEKVSFISAALQAARKATAKFTGEMHNAAKYDKVYFVSPVWAGALATPIRSYMSYYKDSIKSYELLVTCGSSGLEGAAKDAQTVIGKPAANAEQFTAKEVKQGSFNLDKFAA
ncbi:hypothetical protein AGMMS49992_06680 [Clostridia bacterium]|nr:hypothetical protein AGMMS49992_06680 [Clostridia bacterium]